MIKVIVTAPKGKMDSLIIQEIIKDKEIQLVGAIAAKGRDYIGKDVGIVCGFGQEVGSFVYDNIEEIIKESDIIIDFSTRQLSMEILEMSTKYNKALICGTTGFSEEENMKFEEASKQIPLLKAANTSFMVGVMVQMMELAAKLLGDKYKIEILDMHDEKKVDAPSGTALEFGERMSKASGIPTSQMEFHSIRAGDIPSSHTIYFGGEGERIELTHHSYNWKCYAKGAVCAAKFMNGKKTGLYSMEQVISNYS